MDGVMIIIVAILLQILSSEVIDAKIKFIGAFNAYKEVSSGDAGYDAAKKLVEDKLSSMTNWVIGLMVTSYTLVIGYALQEWQEHRYAKLKDMSMGSIFNMEHWEFWMEMFGLFVCNIMFVLSFISWI